MRSDAITLCISIFRLYDVHSFFLCRLQSRLHYELFLVVELSPVHDPALYKGLSGRLWAAILAAISCLSKSRMSCLYFKNYRGSSKMLRLEKDEKRPFQAFYLGHHTAIFTHIIRNGLHPPKILIFGDPDLF